RMSGALRVSTAARAPRGLGRIVALLRATVVIAALAPLLANAAPLCVVDRGHVRFPAFARLTGEDLLWLASGALAAARAIAWRWRRRRAGSDAALRARLRRRLAAALALAALALVAVALLRPAPRFGALRVDRDSLAPAEALVIRAPVAFSAVD